MADRGRTIHAELGEEQVVRYDCAGQWYVEYVPDRYRPRRRLNLQAAVDWALDLAKEGGEIHLGRPGGLAFDRRLKALGFDGTERPEEASSG